MAIITLNDGTICGPVIMIGDQTVDISGMVLGCKKISLDISKIKKLEKIFNLYKIPANETLRAYCKDMVSTVSEPIFTDKAIYLLPRESGTLPSNRITYEDLAQYIITQESDKGCVCLQNASREHKIIESTLIFKNTAGTEILNLLEAIQTELLRNSPSARETMDAVAHGVFDLARNEMKTGQIGKRTKILLKSLETRKTFSDRCAYLLAESVFRLCNSGAYEEFLSHLPPSVSSDMKTTLRKIPDEFSDNLIADLSNLQHDFSDAYLKQLYQNITYSSDIPKFFQMVLVYVCVRLKQFKQARQQTEIIKKKYGSSAGYLLEDFICLWGNKLMGQTLDAIAQGQKLSNEWHGITDGIALTPLHYAIIMGLDQAVSDLLATGHWENDMDYLPKGAIRDVYSYTILSCFKQSPNKFEVFSHTSAELKDIISLKSELENQLEMCTQQIKNLDRYLREADYQWRKLERDGADEGEVGAAYSAYKEMHDSLWNLKRMSVDLLDKISDVNREIDNTYEVAHHNALSILGELNSSCNPVVNFIFALYLNCEESYTVRALFADNARSTDFRMYMYDGFYFLLPCGIQLNLPYRTVYVKEDGSHSNDMQITPNDCAFGMKAYGNSWFSADAHRDVLVLKEEYRELAKQYHPDVCRAAFAEAAFKELKEEYSVILSGLRR